MQKYYRTLGLETDAPLEQVRRAYLDLVQVWHPDRFANNERLAQLANEKLVEINEAYRVIRTTAGPNRDARNEAFASQCDPIDWHSTLRNSSTTTTNGAPSAVSESQRYCGSASHRTRSHNVIIALVVILVVALIVIAR